MKQGLDNTRIIFHVDVNSAFLSWSALKALKENPGSVDLRTIPSAVGGDIRERRGVITAKSIPAKRYGVKTGEPVATALKKCPNLVLVRSDFQTYRRYSHAYMKILRQYSDLVEQASIDEAYLDMTGTEHPEETAQRIRDEVRKTLGFTVNVGISTNKLLAKTASDLEKPDKTHTLWPWEIPSKLWTLPIGTLHGCGASTASKLRTIGIETIGDAAHTELSILMSVLGEKAGRYIYESANGRGSDTVHGEREEAKSYSNETTTAEDITRDNYEIRGAEIIHFLAEKVASRLARDGVYGKTVTVTVKTEEFHRHSRQMVLSDSTQDGAQIEAAAQRLFEELLVSPNGLFPNGHTIRLVGVGVSKLDHGEYRQMDLFSYLKEEEVRRREQKIDQEKMEKRKRLDEMMGRIRTKYGEKAVQKGVDGKRTL